MSQVSKVVFLLDVDNTLLDNDRVAADLNRHTLMKVRGQVRANGRLRAAAEVLLRLTP